MPAPIMPGGRCRINLLSRTAVMLFSREDLLGIESLAGRQSGRPNRNGRRIVRTVPPWQFRLDSAAPGLSERAPEIERPYPIRHRLGRNAMQAKSLAERGCQVIRRDGARGSRI